MMEVDHKITLISINNVKRIIIPKNISLIFSAVIYAKRDQIEQLKDMNIDY